MRGPQLLGLGHGGQAGGLTLPCAPFSGGIACLRIPVLRSLVSFVEMMVLMVSLHRRNGLRRGARLLALLVAALACDMGLGLVVSLRRPNVLAADIITAVLVFGLGIAGPPAGAG